MPDDPSDEVLMRRAAAGDETAFDVLRGRYASTIHDYLRHALGAAADVDAISGEVFLRASRFAATYRYPQKFSTWLFTIARNVAINRERRDAHPPVINLSELNLGGVDLSGDPQQVAAGATDDPKKRAEIVRVLKALDELPTEQKEVVVLGVFQGMSYAAMEKFTRTSADTLRDRMFRALRALASLLRPDDSSH